MNKLIKKVTLNKITISLIIAIIVLIITIFTSESISNDTFPLFRGAWILRLNIDKLGIFSFVSITIITILFLIQRRKASKIVAFIYLFLTFGYLFYITSTMFIGAMHYYSERSFRRSVVTNDYKAITNYLAKIDNINKKDGDDNTPLMIALQLDRCDIANQIIEKGADINVQDRPFTLFIASKQCPEIAKIIVGKGIDHNLKYHSKSPIIAAASAGQTDLVIYYIRLGVEKEDINKSLIAAAINNSIDTVKVLIDNQATSLDEAFRGAISYSHFDIVTYLLQKGANINYEDNFNKTALMEAVILDDIQGVKFLLNNKADPNIVNSKNQKALDLIGYSSNREELIKLLQPVTKK